MALPRVIPVLLLRNNGLVKTVQFKNHTYIGDPINAVKIFNEKEVDEICFLDIDASKENREPPFEYLKEIASECFMPLSYGGAVKSIAHIKRLIQSGVEKVIINSHAISNPDFIREATDIFGSSTIVGAMDVRRNLWGKAQVYAHVQRKNLSIDVVQHAQYLQALGVGEIFVNNVDADGQMKGYDIDLIAKITKGVDVPVIACGGCGSLADIDAVVNVANARAAAAGSFFVFQGKHKAVLITYPPYKTLQKVFTKSN